MDYDIRINFTEKYTCWFNEVKDYLDSWIWSNIIGGEGRKLYFSSYSKYACYDFKIIEIDHNEKIVKLLAVPQ
jgi:hypothetical protein